MTQVYNNTEPKFDNAARALFVLRLYVVIASACAYYVIFAQNFLQQNHDWSKTPENKLAERFARRGDMESAFKVSPYYAIETKQQYESAKKIQNPDASVYYSMVYWAKDNDDNETEKFEHLGKEKMIEEFKSGDMDVLSTQSNIQSWNTDIDNAYQRGTIKEITPDIQKIALANTKKTCENAKKAYWYSTSKGDEVVKNNFKKWADSFSITECTNLYKDYNGGLNGFFIYN